MSQLEWLVGAKGIVLLGVLILVIAAGLFLKEAWERGWFATIPDGLRCILSACFGTSLIAIGELVRRRINPLASSGVSAAGIAIVYGSVLAAAQLYQLLSLPTAFAMLAFTTMLGIALGSLSSRVMLAAFSLIGAFLVPILLGSDEPSRFVMPAYLIALLTLGLGLTAWRGPTFAIIRRIAWWGTAILGSLWIWSIHDVAPTSAFVFVSAVWLMTISELIASARFFHWLRPNRLWPETATHGITRNDAQCTIEFDIMALMRPEARWLNSIFGVTAWSVIAAGFVVKSIAPEFDWIVPMTLAAASILIILTCSPNRPRPWVSAATPMSALTSAMAINAAALIALTVATGLVGPIQVVAWGLIGLAAVYFGWRVRFHAANLLGLGFISIGAARLIAFDLPQAAGMINKPQINDITRILGLAITAWTWQMTLIAGTVTAAAAMQRREHLRRFLDVCALAALATCVFGPGSAIGSIGVAWCVIAVIAAWIAARHARIGLSFAAPTLLALGSIAAGVAGLDSVNTANNTPILSQLGLAWSNWSWTMLLVAACWITLGNSLASTTEQRSIAGVLAILAVSLAIIGDATPMPTAVLAWALLYAVITVIGTRVSTWRVTELGIAFAFANAVAWFGIVLSEGWPGVVGMPILHRLFIAGAITIATLVVGTRLLRRANRGKDDQHDHQPPEHLRALTNAVHATSGLMALIITSLEMMRITEWIVPDDTAARSAALSIWWSLFALATIALGIAKNRRAVRWTGLILIAVAAGKVLLIDLATLTALWRIVGSAAVGLILLAAGIAYARLMREGVSNLLNPQQSQLHAEPTSSPENLLT